VHTGPIYCTFDDDIDTGACLLIESHNYIYKWEKPTAKSFGHLEHDVTTGLGGGKVLWLNTTGASNSNGIVGEITTPLLNTTGKCLMLFHFISWPNLHFVVQIVEENLRVVFSKDLISSINNHKHLYIWWPYFFTLPIGLHWIKLTVQAEILIELTINVIDDFSIRPCEDYKRECLLSSKGLEYMGQVSQTFDGSQCTKWGDVKVKKSDDHIRVANSIMFMLDTSADDYFNLQATHWRKTSSCHGASSSDVHGAQCYDGSVMSVCDVPYCACATGWFQCPTGQCLPNRMSIDDCLDTRGKWINQTQRRYSVNISRPDENPTFHDKIYELHKLKPYMTNKTAYDKLAQYQEAEMRKFIVDTSLARDRFILECQWESGNVCSDLFTQRFTEMGLCYTFNANSSNSTHSNAVGEMTSGLQLTLNTQSSEIIDKVGQNGLKLLLFDPSKDVELMHDYGINISPGFYTTIGVSLEQATNMKAPYGTCDDIELRHTNDTYSYSRCVLDHATTSFMQECNCSMPYMPGQYVQCTIRDYLTCNYKLKPRMTKCPSRCNATVFNFKLSSTTLSTASTLNKLSEQQKLALQFDIELAHEAHSRVDYIHLSDFIQVFDIDLYKKLFLVESLVEEKIVKPAKIFFRYLDDYTKFTLFKAKYELREFLFGYGYVKRVDNFIYHVHRHGEALTGLINYAQITKSRSQQNPLNINRLILFAQATLEAVKVVNYDGKQVQLELEQRCKNIETKLFSCMDEFLNIASAIQFMLDNFFANHSYTLTTKALIPNDDDMPCTPVCNVSDHGLNAFLANIETLHNEYKHSEMTCFNPFERLISSICHHKFTLHDGNLTKKIKFLLQLVDFRSVRSVFQSAVLDFLHKHVTRKDANTNLIIMIENLATRVVSLKHAIRNVLQVILPQLLQEQLDEYKNVFKHELHIVDLLSRHFLPQSNSEQENRKDPVYYTILNVFYAIREKFVYEEPNTTYEDLTNAIYNRNSFGEITLHNKTVFQTIDELLQHFGFDEVEDELVNEMKMVHDEVIAQLRSVEHHLNGVLQHTTAYTNSLRIGDNFVRDNIAVVKIYYTDMKIKHTDQSAAYSWSAFFSDLGGSLGLLLGASVLSLIEVLDMCFYNFTVYACRK
jgi:hypothetical protein